MKVICLRRRLARVKLIFGVPEQDFPFLPHGRVAIELFIGTIEMSNGLSTYVELRRKVRKRRDDLSIFQ